MRELSGFIIQLVAGDQDNAIAGYHRSLVVHVFKAVIICKY